MCGIFAYLNFNCPKTRDEILQILLGGLKRLEYRGYDSAGIAFDGDSAENALTEIIKTPGRLDALQALLAERKFDLDKKFEDHIGIAHTRWATHGGLTVANAHPHGSAEDEFVVIHNGIITNCVPLRQFLVSKGYSFKSETDSECIPILIHHLWNTRKEELSFAELIEQCLHQLEGTFAIVVKSRLYPNELVAARRGSSLLIGVKSSVALNTNQIPVYYSKDKRLKPQMNKSALLKSGKMGSAHKSIKKVFERQNSTDMFFRNDSDRDSDTGSVSSLSSLDGKAKAQLTPKVSSSNLLDLVTPEHPNVNASDDVFGDEDKKQLTENNLTSDIEYFFSSDASAIIEHTNRVIYMEDGDIASISDGGLMLQRIPQQTDNEIVDQVEIGEVEMELQQIMKGNFDTFMQKEIYEQPEAAVNAMRGRVNFEKKKVMLGGLRNHIHEIKRCRRIIMIACGTSYHAAHACRQLIEEMTDLPVNVEVASDFVDRKTPIFRDDVCFFVSQSGETADTLAALKICKQKGSLTVGITNTASSTVSRETDCGVHCNAGIEIGVASTKAYTSQFVVLVMFALMMSEDRYSKRKRFVEVLEALKDLPSKLEETLKLDDQIRAIAPSWSDKRSVLVMGRGYNYATCLEGALKIKEISYLHSEGILSGELKHGPLALVDEHLPIIMIVCRDHTYSKCLNAVQQVASRQGRPVLICDEDLEDELEKFSTNLLKIPTTVDCLKAALAVIPLQLMSYHLATLRGLNVDLPRALAKVITTE